MLKTIQVLAVGLSSAFGLFAVMAFCHVSFPLCVLTGLVAGTLTGIKCVVSE